MDRGGVQRDDLDVHADDVRWSETTGTPRRILVAGTSGAGKTTVATSISARTGVPHVELDALFHGPGWVPRPGFADDVAALAAGDSWVTEWQYSAARPLLLERAQLLVWLDLPRWRVFAQLLPRTVVRRVRRTELWNGNVEPPLHTVFTDRDHLLRWAWRTHPDTGRRIARAQSAGGCPPVVRLRSRRQVRAWLDGLSAAGGARWGCGRPGPGPAAGSATPSG